jgi:hypothetical protein
MKKLHPILPLLILFFVSSCNTTFHVDQVKQGDTINGFMRYSLPKNYTLVKLKLQKTVTKPGKYANEKATTSESDYKTILKNLNNDLEVTDAFKPIKETEGEISFKFLSMEIADTFVVDKNCIYELKFDKKWNKKSNFTVTTSQRGIVQGVKLEEYDQTLDLITEIGSTGARIAGSFLLAPKDNAVIGPTLQELYKTTTKDSVREASALAIELITVKKRIADLNKVTNLMLFQDKTHYDQTLKKYEDREKELTALFSMEKEIKEYTVEMVIDYTGTINQSKTLCWISPKKGVKFENSTIIVASDTVGITTKADLAKEAKVVDVNFKFYETVDQVITSATTFNSTAKGIDGGIRYRIPLFVHFELYTNKKMLKSKILPVSQLGKVVTLPKKLNTADITFYENLGLIKSISGASNGIAKEQIAAIAGAAEKIDNMVPTDDQKLDKEVKHLELLKKKKDLETQLGMD